MSRVGTVSPTMFQSYMACPTRFAFQTWGGFGFGSRATQFGTRVHSEIERAIQDGTATTLAAAEKIFTSLPVGLPYVIEERLFATLGEVKLSGQIDLYAALEDKIFIFDHKTSSDPHRWAMSKEELEQSAQATFYGFLIGQEFDYDDETPIHLQWNYVESKDHPKGKEDLLKFRRVEGLLTVGDCRDKMRRNLPILEEVQQHSQNKTSPSLMKFNTDHCSAYGGCPAKSVCPHLRKKEEAPDMTFDLKKWREQNRAGNNTKNETAQALNDVPPPPPVEKEEPKQESLPTTSPPKRRKVSDLVGKNTEEAAKAAMIDRAASIVPHVPEAKPLIVPPVFDKVSDVPFDNAVVVETKKEETVKPRARKQKALNPVEPPTGLQAGINVMQTIMDDTAKDSQQRQEKDVVKGVQQNLFLYIDCIPMGTVVQDIQEVLAPLRDQVNQDAGVGHYKLVPYGQGAGMLAALVEKTKISGVFYVRSRMIDPAVLEVLVTQAGKSNIVQGVF